VERASRGTFHTIVVSTDGTPFAMRAKIIVVAVVDTGAMADFIGAPERERRKVEEELGYNAEEALAKVGKLAAKDGVDVEMIVRRGRPHIEIVAVANQADADLIVMGKTSGYRAARHLIGSVTQRVIEDADCSVLLVR
jgi:nucleotide-binding universal stress UspA family protein